MLVVGLTGGVASGKSTVRQHFQALGINCIDADEIAKALSQPGEKCFAKITAHFGPKILKKSGVLDRAALRKIIFQNPEEKKWLEDLLHPEIRLRIQQAIAQTASAYCVVEIPLLAESNDIHFIDRVLVVDAAANLQISRLTERDGIDQSSAERILANQASREQRLAIADDIINNNGSPEALANAVKQQHQRYLQQAQSLE
jgi:dephospho-CoA kinase